ncbi:type VII secretion system-associated protein [Amycolatopsis sp. lyj-23]|uniref:type VII secretion system-associated protein n=1 Tax=Amycolatopsis sp. lyj-23 TaxID=2789283 RepID=UPI00397B5DB0
MLRLVLQGRAESEHIQLVLRDTLLDVAMTGEDRPLATKSPDDVRCVVVVTGEPHRRRIASPGWQRVDLGELVGLLADGADALFNPGGPASVRLSGEFLRETLAMDGARIDALHANAGRDASSSRVITWEPAPEPTRRSE